MDMCPKCNAKYHPGSTECVKCGVIFDKYRACMDRKVQPENIPTQTNEAKSENYPEQDQKDNKAKPSYIIIFGGCFILFCVIIALYGEFSGMEKVSFEKISVPKNSIASPAKVPVQHNNTPGAVKSSASIKQSITNQAFDGSTAQSTALLELIENNPQYIDYQVSKELTDEVILFGCNIDKKVIIRIHQRKDGTGTQEVWTDHILYRLKTSKEGGSLNETPQGNIPGSFFSF